MENSENSLKYKGAHVTWKVNDRTYLGEVTGTYQSDKDGRLILKVKHFNGEDAPDVAVIDVKFLKRTYETTCYICGNVIEKNDYSYNAGNDRNGNHKLLCYWCRDHYE